MMKAFPSELKFKHPWRNYQERVLQELERHLDDRKLHIIAPPGSGKTILGLEVIRRINKPTLILSPTLTIRDQWIERLVELFLEHNHTEPDWISRDIHNPRFLTVSTYQALHCAMVGKRTLPDDDENEEEDDSSVRNEKNGNSSGTAEEFSRKLRRRGIKTILVDECHHLKNEWWKSLVALVGELDDPITVALTATPPYDVNVVEWERYNQFCGPVDCEISVPELILRKDICPHQDYIYFSFPTGNEGKVIDRFIKSTAEFYSQLCNDKEFVEILRLHPFIKDPDANIEAILLNPEYFSSLLIFLHHAGVDLDNKYFSILGVKKKKTPSLNYEWVEVLLSEVLYGDESFYETHKAKLRPLRDQLHRFDAIENRKITLRTNSQLFKLLTESISKLDSIVEIVRAEHASLGSELRMVILTDFIRKSYLPTSSDDHHEYDKLGAIPIFEKVRTSCGKNITLGILTGSIVVIPKEKLNDVRNICLEKGIGKNCIQSRPLIHTPDFLLIEIQGIHKKRIVEIFTHLFELGHINVIIGTKSLLGEGWDSPSINSLVLASFVGSFVLTNQMRGRAIRTQGEKPSKAANIWHLACVNEFISEWGDDIDLLKRRFDAFLGISFYEDTIERGFKRTGLGPPPFTRERVTAINYLMMNGAAHRSAVHERWQRSLEKGEKIASLLRTAPKNIHKGFVYRKTITALFLQGVYLGFFIFSMLGRSIRSIREPELLLRAIGIAFGIAFIIALPKCLRAVWLFVRNGPVEAELINIGGALLRTLISMKEITTDFSKIKLIIEKENDGTVNCRIDGATYYETTLYLSCLHEILAAISNPRYLIRRINIWHFLRRSDYHMVPEKIGKHKDGASLFSSMWGKYVGYHNLIYTRTPEGRRTLLKARGFAISSAFDDRSQIVSKWK